MNDRVDNMTLTADPVPMPQMDHHVKIHLTQTNLHVDGEYLWAFPQDQPNQYKVDNIPFFAHGIHLGDIVETRSTDDPYDCPEIVRVVERSTWRTVRILTETEAQEELVLNALKAIDATWEGGALMGAQLWAAAIPTAADVEALAEVLDAMNIGMEPAEEALDHPRVPCPQCGELNREADLNDDEDAPIVCLKCHLHPGRSAS